MKNSFLVLIAWSVLAKSYCTNGRHNEALALASEALNLALAQQQNDFAPEAEKVLAQLQASGIKVNQVLSPPSTVFLEPGSKSCYLESRWKRHWLNVNRDGQETFRLDLSGVRSTIGG